MDKPTILKAAELPAATTAALNDIFNVLEFPHDKSQIAGFLREYGPTIRGMALRKAKVDAALLDALPAIEIISSYSAGLDNLDVDHAKSRGIKIENTSHILAEDVANLAIGLALSVTRDIVAADGYVRAGTWRISGQYPLGRSLSRMRVGVVGLGAIGSAIVPRLQALGAKIAYFGPRQKPVDIPYYADVTQLASACDMLVLTCPLSPETHHLVNASVIEALGARGYLVNVSRGPIVDERALIQALAENKIAGAALDVFENEPNVPEELIADPRVVLTPHIGSATEETRIDMANNVVDTLVEHFGIMVPCG